MFLCTALKNIISIFYGETVMPDPEKRATSDLDVVADAVPTKGDPMRFDTSHFP